MMAELEQTNVFRRKTMERISSPEQLTDYLRVTNPGIWVVLAAVMLLLAGLLTWSAMGSMETRVFVVVEVEDHIAQIAATGAEDLQLGMSLRVAGQDLTIVSVEEDKFGRQIGTTEVNLPDGSYDGTVVTEETRPIDYLLSSR